MVILLTFESEKRVDKPKACAIIHSTREKNMTKPDQATRKLDQYKRQLKMLEVYVAGRIRQLDHIARQSPGETPACDMSKSELNIILTQVLPQMREVQA